MSSFVWGSFFNSMKANLGESLITFSSSHFVCLYHWLDITMDQVSSLLPSIQKLGQNILEKNNMILRQQRFEPKSVTGWGRGSRGPSDTRTRTIVSHSQLSVLPFHHISIASNNYSHPTNPKMYSWTWKMQGSWAVLQPTTRWWSRHFGFTYRKLSWRQSLDTDNDLYTSLQSLKCSFGYKPQ